MKRILILLLALIPFASFAQALSKEEKKAKREQMRAERAEARRIEDSLAITRDARLAAANAKWDSMESQPKKENRDGATSLICKTIYDTEQEAFDLLVRNLLSHGIVPSDINDKYFIIKTARKQVGNATYEIVYTVYIKNGKAVVRASATAYGQFSVGVGMFRSSTDMVVPVEYGGKKDSLFGIAWSEMERQVKEIPHTECIYQ